MKEDGLIRIVKDAIIRQAVLAADLKELLKQHNDMVKQQEHQLEEERVKIQSKLQRYKNGLMKKFQSSQKKWKVRILF